MKTIEVTNAFALELTRDAKQLGVDVRSLLKMAMDTFSEMVASGEIVVVGCVKEAPSKAPENHYPYPSLASDPYRSRARMENKGGSSCLR
jgi:hypothetical protein